MYTLLWGKSQDSPGMSLTLWHGHLDMYTLLWGKSQDSPGMSLTLWHVHTLMGEIPGLSWDVSDFVTWTFRHAHTLMGGIPGLLWNVPDLVTWTLRHVHTLMGEIPGFSWNVPYFVTCTHSYGGNPRVLLECSLLCDMYTLLWGKSQGSPGMFLTLWHVHTLMGEIPGFSWNVPYFVTCTHSYGGNPRTLLECPWLCDMDT